LSARDRNLFNKLQKMKLIHYLFLISFLCGLHIFGIAQCTQPEPPQITNIKICEGEANIPLCANGSDVRWYANSNKTGIIYYGNCYTPGEHVSYCATFKYYATQTINGCESETAQATYTIECVPIPPTVTVIPEKISENEPDPIFEASTIYQNQRFRWYDENYSFIQESNYYEPNRLNGLVYYVSQIPYGCESYKIPVEITFYDNTVNLIKDKDLSSIIIYNTPHNILFTNTKNIKFIYIYNQLGQIIEISDKKELDLSKFICGIYFLRIETEKESYLNQIRIPCW